MARFPGDVIYIWHAALHSVACIGEKETIVNEHGGVAETRVAHIRKIERVVSILKNETAAVFDPLLAPARYKGRMAGAVRASRISSRAC